MTQFDLSPEPGWETLENLEMFFSVCGSFINSPPEEQRMQVRYFLQHEPEAVVGKVYFGPKCLGAPGFVHGGCESALMDEIMGIASWAGGYPVVTGEFVTRFRDRLPLESMAYAEGRVINVKGRKVFTKGQILSPEGKVYCEAEGTYIKLRTDHYERFLAGVHMKDS
jgi:acyl-coenzyme A thioesterase PaaI-like protein